MSVLCDRQIRALAMTEGMIEPFVPIGVRERDGSPVLSFGVSSYGYDARLADEFKVFEPVVEVGPFGEQRSFPIVDPKAFNPEHFTDVQADHLDIPPHGFVLGRTLEWFNVPRDILAVCYAKSTYARCGIVVGVTPLEPEWRGHVTLEFSNTTDLPARIYANEGVVQFLFLRADEPCATSYADRGGKYQNQVGVTLPRM